MNIIIERKDKICTIMINRPQVRNAVDRETAEELTKAFQMFEEDDDLYVAVLCGANGMFCAGADLKEIASGHRNRLEPDMQEDGPMGPTRMHLSKPVIAAVQGFAVAGGLELAIWCDMRVVENNAVFGVFCRRFGVPMVDGGTQRLPRLIGMGRALELILTGRSVGAYEALAMGLANQVVQPGEAIKQAQKLATEIARFPQLCLRSDREAVYWGFDLDFDKAMKLEFSYGLGTLNSEEFESGVTRFVRGQGRHGQF